VERSQLRKLDIKIKTGRSPEMSRAQYKKFQNQSWSHLRRPQTRRITGQ
jgi:hypothetical protein